MTEDEMVGWHHRLNGHEFEQALGVGDGQGSLVCFSPRGCKESDTTEQLNWTERVQGDTEIHGFQVLMYSSQVLKMQHFSIRTLTLAYQTYLA